METKHWSLSTILYEMSNKTLALSAILGEMSNEISSISWYYVSDVKQNITIRW